MLGQVAQEATSGATMTVYGKRGCLACDRTYRELAKILGEEYVELRHVPDMTAPEFAKEHNWREDESTDLMAAIAHNDMDFPVIRIAGYGIVFRDQAIAQAQRMVKLCTPDPTQQSQSTPAAQDSVESQSAG
jgi:glutaredoxin